MLNMKEGGHSEYGICFPSHSYLWLSPALQRMAEHLPAQGKWMNSFICFACVSSFCFTYETVFNSTYTISHFHSSDSLPHPMGVCVPSCLLPHKSKASTQNWTRLCLVHFYHKDFLIFIHKCTYSVYSVWLLQFPGYLHDRGKKHLQTKAKEHYVEFNILFKQAAFLGITFIIMNNPGICFRHTEEWKHPSTRQTWQKQEAGTAPCES